MTTQHTPEPLIPAIRQYKHNDGSDGFVIAFDEKLTIAAFAQLEQQRDDIHKNYTDLAFRLTDVEQQRDELQEKLAISEVMYQSGAHYQAKCEELLTALIELVEMSEEPPERNCSCHINPPCRDCVNYSGIREALECARKAIAKAQEGGK
jgi:hypothetical protein